MSINSVEILKKYFSVPYNGHVFIFTNPVTLADVQQHTFTEILSHKNAVDAKGLHGNSLALSIFEAITKHVDNLTGKKILDIGGNTGYFSFLSTEAGANATMIEMDTWQATVAKAMAEVRGLKVQIINSSIQNYLESSAETFDYAFMFNMFDQMLRTNEESAWKTLLQVSKRSKMLFFMMGPTEQIPTAKGIATGTPLVPAQAISRYSKLDYEVILAKTVYSNYKILLENANNGRCLHVFW